MEWRNEARARTRLTVVLAALLAACAGTPASSGREASLKSLVEAERGFARRSIEVGYRTAFIENFASDGIGWYPDPQVTRTYFQSRPPRADLPIIEWGPIVAEVAAAGDLGYTAGPSRFLKGSTRDVLNQGYFFSVWKREGGVWRVAADAGIGSPTAHRDFPPARVDVPAAESLVPAFAAADACSELRAREQWLSGDVAATKAATMPYARLHRNEFDPVVGSEAIDAFAAKQPAALNWSRTYATDTCIASASRDLGATWGRVMEQGALAGYYLRAWRRDGRGEWRIALEQAAFLPKDAAKRAG
jgi:ketosteroid isomerase-like protein